MTACNYCRGGDLVKNGKRHNKNITKQLYYCKACKRKFTEDDGFWKMKNTKETITEAIDLHDKGMSYDAASNHMHQHHNVKVSGRSVLNWVIKYAKKLGKFVCKLVPEIRGRIHMDEVVFKVKKKHRYYWHAKDSKTKFKFSGNLTIRGYEEGAKPLFKQIKQRCYEQFMQKKDNKPIRFVSDGLEHYIKGFMKYFNRIAEITHGVPIACKKYKLEHNNNCIERDNLRLKQRYYSMKGFKDIESAEEFLHLSDMLYNFTYVPLNMKITPAEAAGIKLSLGRNRLLSLIEI